VFQYDGVVVWVEFSAHLARVRVGSRPF